MGMQEMAGQRPLGHPEREPRTELQGTKERWAPEDTCGSRPPVRGVSPLLPPGAESPHIWSAPFGEHTLGLPPLGSENHLGETEPLRPG